MTSEDAEITEDTSTGDFDARLDSALLLRGKILDRISRFEQDLDSFPDRTYLDEEGKAVHPIPEVTEEGRDTLRRDFYSELHHLFSSLSEDNYSLSSTYESAVYSLILDSMRRNFGYYQAFSRAEAELLRRNSDIGDATALSFSVSDIQSLLSKLDSVDFTRNLCVSLGLESKDTEAIISCLITKEFSRR